VVWGRRPGSVVVVVTGTDVVVALVGTLETREPDRAVFGCEEWAGVPAPHAVPRRAIARTPRAARTDALNRADGWSGGRVLLGEFVRTSLSVVFCGWPPGLHHLFVRRSFSRWRPLLRPSVTLGLLDPRASGGVSVMPLLRLPAPGSQGCRTRLCPLNLSPRARVLCEPDLRPMRPRPADN
jgi:hypothetical protein